MNETKVVKIEFQGITQFASDVKDSDKAFKKFVRDLAKASGVSSKELNKNKDALKSLFTSYQAFNKELVVTSKVADKAEKETKELTKAEDALSTATKKTTDNTKAKNIALKQLNSGPLKGFGQAIKLQAADGLALGASMAGLAAAATFVVSAYSDLNAVASNLDLKGDDLKSTATSLTTTSRVFNVEGGKITEVFNKLSSISKSSSAEISSFLRNALSQGASIEQINMFSEGLKGTGLTLKDLEGTLQSVRFDETFDVKQLETISPLINNIKVNAAGAGKELTKAFGKEFSDTLIQGVQNGSINAAQATAMLKSEIVQSGKETKNYKDLITNLYGGYNEGIVDAIDNTTSLVNSVTAIQSEIDKYNDKLSLSEKATGTLLNGLSAWLGVAAEIFEPVIDLFNDLYDAFVDNTNGLSDITGGLTGFGIALAKNINPLNAFINAVRAGAEALGLLQASIGEVTNAEKEFITTNERTNAAIEDISSIQQAIDTYDKYAGKLNLTAQQKAELARAIDTLSAADKRFVENGKVNTDLIKKDQVARVRALRESLDRQILLEQQAFQALNAQLRAGTISSDDKRFQQSLDRTSALMQTRDQLDLTIKTKVDPKDKIAKSIKTGKAEVKVTVSFSEEISDLKDALKDSQTDEEFDRRAKQLIAAADAQVKAASANAEADKALVEQGNKARKNAIEYQTAANEVINSSKNFFDPTKFGSRFTSQIRAKDLKGILGLENAEGLGRDLTDELNMTIDNIVNNAGPDGLIEIFKLIPGRPLDESKAIISQIFKDYQDGTITSLEEFKTKLEAAGSGSTVLDALLGTKKQAEDKVKENIKVAEEAQSKVKNDDVIRAIKDRERVENDIEEERKKREELKAKAAEELEKNLQNSNSETLKTLQRLFPTVSREYEKIQDEIDNTNRKSIETITEAVKTLNTAIGKEVAKVNEDGSVSIIGAGSLTPEQDVILAQFQDFFTNTVTARDAIIRKLESDKEKVKGDIARAILGLTKEDLDNVLSDLDIFLQRQLVSIDRFRANLDKADRDTQDMSFKDRRKILSKFYTGILAEEENAYEQAKVAVDLFYQTAIARATAAGADTSAIIAEYETKLGQLELDFFKKQQELEASKKKLDDERDVRIKKLINNGVAITQGLQRLSDNIFDLIANNFDKTLDAINMSVEDIENRISESRSRLDELESELEIRQSGRRDAVLAAIDREKAKEEDLAKTKLKLLKQQEKEEKRLANIRKAQAIANAVINGAIAQTNIWATVPKVDFGVSTVALSAISAAITGTQIALIASQQFAQGGFTGDGTIADNTGHKVAGVVHNDEWVAPKWMVESPKYAPMIGQLESARTKGFADGGFTSSTSSSIDVGLKQQRNADRIFNAAVQLADRPIYANPIEFNNVSSSYARKIRTTTIGG